MSSGAKNNNRERVWRMRGEEKMKFNNDLTEKEQKAELIKSAKTKQIFDPQTNQFDYSKGMVTDLEENCSVYTYRKKLMRCMRVNLLY